jgi:hypothetical protein
MCYNIVIIKVQHGNRAEKTRKKISGFLKQNVQLLNVTAPCSAKLLM